MSLWNDGDLKMDQYLVELNGIIWRKLESDHQEWERLRWTEMTVQGVRLNYWKALQLNLVMTMKVHWDCCLMKLEFCPRDGHCASPEQFKYFSGPCRILRFLQQAVSQLWQWMVANNSARGNNFNGDGGWEKLIKSVMAAHNPDN